MAKIKSTITGGHEQAYKRIRHSESLAGTTRDGTSVHVQTNCRPLDSMVESESVRTTSEYDWKTGEFKKKKLDIVENAKRNINYLNVHPVTDARRHKDDDKQNGMGACSPSVSSDRWGRR